MVQLVPVQDSDSSAHSSSGGSAANKWSAAGRKVKAELQTSSAFKTLRDQHDVNVIDADCLRVLRKLGEGAFAIVEKCEYIPIEGAEPQIVAVKQLKPAVLNEPGELDAFLAECCLMRKLKHRYIVDYIGVGSKDTTSEQAARSTMFMVQEFMGGGTLRSVVSEQMSRPGTCTYTNAQALKWMQQVASAMAYLHDANPLVIHRDLKMENILLTADKQVAKLADFGLAGFTRRQALSFSGASGFPSRTTPLQISQFPSVSQPGLWVDDQDDILTERLSRLQSKVSFRGKMFAGFQPQHLFVMKDQMSGRTGTYMYMAPEMYLNERYNEKVDVFSLGIIMYEVFHRYLTICAVSINGTQEEIEAYAHRVSCGYRPPLDDKAWPPQFVSLIRACWAQDPADRPTMKQVVEELQQIERTGLPKYQIPSCCGCTIS